MPVSPARAAAFDILMRVEREASFADEILHSNRLDELSPADRALCTELVMGVLRWRSRLDDMLREEVSRPLQKLDLEVLVALRLGVYQIGWLDRIPARAAVNESVELVKRARKRSAAPFVNAVLRNLQQPAVIKPRVSLGNDLTNLTAGALAEALAEAYAHPEWLVERWLHAYGGAAQAICKYGQRAPVPALRLLSPEVELELPSDGVEIAPGLLVSRARRVVRGDITKTRGFAKGGVAVQDEASQLVALLVGKGKRLLDCCAAPGGKTALLAARNPDALVVAAELHPRRAQLMKRLVRAPNVRLIAARAEALPLAVDFDRVLADVPCSGTGTLARNPDIKWRLKPDDLADLHGRQVAILRGALAHLAPGGRLVYSTCSLEREENEAVIEEVTEGRSDLRLVDCREELERLRDEDELAWSNLESLLCGPFLRTLPGVHPCDGFFAAILERK